MTYDKKEVGCLPRPRKFRRICCMPEKRNFGPLQEGEIPLASISMTLEEYETIRLIDLEGLTQAQCAESMGTARTTVQAMYCEARHKLAQSLVEGRALTICGGSFVLCQRGEQGCCRCRRHSGGIPESCDKPGRYGMPERNSMPEEEDGSGGKAFDRAVVEKESEG